ncbi:FAD-dependent oxidoreductase [Tissierella carlieri]|uniref:FAD-dependent oxidoreductase n=1 Tax=Tissierella carlieri TaxID=689904 RepID=A0ABT1SGA6_9FIRM|nr:FAD-dependent oxidoreductase [Tissierella carlieri]MBU5313381.1 FAD-dependent oxidoreductase [Tissierella carlieri]MCQ4925510.1 FAD-dependent oxidoreductase [Tissierella carlieri]MDU5082666.1 FAD-dependent oxidoreductase [Bacillota bacterium]
MEKAKYLIIGNGIAGLAAAREIRSNSEEGTIIMVSNEPTLTYYRVKLTEYISKDFVDEDLLVSKENWYQDKNIKVMLRKFVEDIDVINNKVKLDDGQVIEYEKLLIATGSRPFIPPINGKYQEGVFALRTLKDLHYIKDYMKSCEDVSVIGGGLLGLEAAWSLKQLGKNVSIIEFAPYLLPRQLDKEIANKLEEKLSSIGFKVYLSSQAEEITGEGKAVGIKLNGERNIKADAILVSSGIRPNLDLVRDTTIEYDKGIKVDKHLKTNIDNVYAAGDVVEIEGMVLGLWTAGNEQGKVAGANMAGKELEYNQPKIFTTLKIGSIELFSAGIINDFDRVYEYKDEKGDIHHKIFTKDGKIAGVILFGDLKEVNALRNAVISNMDVNEYIEKDKRFK